MQLFPTLFHRNWGCLLVWKAPHTLSTLNKGCLIMTMEMYVPPHFSPETQGAAKVSSSNLFHGLIGFTVKKFIFYHLP